MSNITTESLPLFYLGGYGGYGTFSRGYKNDGNVAQGRFALGAHAMQYKEWTTPVGKLAFNLVIRCVLPRIRQ